MCTLCMWQRVHGLECERTSRRRGADRSAGCSARLPSGCRHDGVGSVPGLTVNRQPRRVAPRRLHSSVVVELMPGLNVQCRPRRAVLQHLHSGGVVVGAAAGLECTAPTSSSRTSTTSRRCRRQSCKCAAMSPAIRRSLDSGMRSLASGCDDGWRLRTPCGLGDGRRGA